MPRVGSTLKLATALAAVACVIAASASSALAHTWAPLNTKFEGKNTTALVFKFSTKEGTASLECGKDTLGGTTAASASASLNATPVIGGCKFFGFAATDSFSCKEGTLPWTLALGTEKGTLKYNCTWTFESPGAGCSIKILEQPAKEGFTWSNVGTKEGVQIKLAVKKLSGKVNIGCLGATEENLEVELTGTYEISNVYVV